MESEGRGIHPKAESANLFIWPIISTSCMEMKELVTFKIIFISPISSPKSPHKRNLTTQVTLICHKLISFSA